MKKIMRTSISSLLVMVLVISLTACGGNKPQNGGTSGSTEAPQEQSAAEENREAASGEEMAKEIDFYAAVLKEEGCLEAAKRFEEETGIKVNVHSYDSADFVQAFMVAANGGSPVDVMLLNGQDVRYFMKNGLIQEMDGKPGADRVNEGAVDQYTYKSKQ